MPLWEQKNLEELVHQHFGGFFEWSIFTDFYVAVLEINFLTPKTIVAITNSEKGKAQTLPSPKKETNKTSNERPIVLKYGSMKRATRNPTTKVNNHLLFRLFKIITAFIYIIS